VDGICISGWADLVAGCVHEYWDAFVAGVPGSGELLAEGLIRLGMPDGKAMKELSPLVRDAAVMGMNNGYIAPGYASMPVPGWSGGMPMGEVAPRAGNGGFESQSQWGNGANGASFKPGQGWIASPQSLQPLTAQGVSGMYSSNKSYMPFAGK